MLNQKNRQKWLPLIGLMMTLPLGVLNYSSAQNKKPDGETINNAYQKSFRYELMQNYGQAIEVLKPVLTAYPKTYTVNYRLGYLYNANREYDAAESHYKTAAEAVKSSISPQLGLMTTYQNTKKYAQAEAIGRQILKKDFYNYYGNLQLATALAYQKKYTDAYTIYQKMLSLYPADITYLTAYGGTLYYGGATSDATQVLSNLLIIDPNNHTALALLKRK